MKWRVIINMSLAQDRDSALGNAIKKCFKQCGITPAKHNSHSWEGAVVTSTEAAEQLKQVLGYLADPKASNYSGELDSMLVYIDRAKDG